MGSERIEKLRHKKVLRVARLIIENDIPGIKAALKEVSVLAIGKVSLQPGRSGATLSGSDQNELKGHMSEAQWESISRLPTSKLKLVQLAFLLGRQEAAELILKGQLQKNFLGCTFMNLDESSPLVKSLALSDQYASLDFLPYLAAIPDIHTVKLLVKDHGADVNGYTSGLFTLNTIQAALYVPETIAPNYKFTDAHIDMITYIIEKMEEKGTVKKDINWKATINRTVPTLLEVILTSDNILYVKAFKMLLQANPSLATEEDIKGNTASDYLRTKKGIPHRAKFKIALKEATAQNSINSPYNNSKLQSGSGSDAVPSSSAYRQFCRALQAAVAAKESQASKKVLAEHLRNMLTSFTKIPESERQSCSNLRAGMLKMYQNEVKDPWVQNYTREAYEEFKNCGVAACGTKQGNSSIPTGNPVPTFSKEYALFHRALNSLVTSVKTGRKDSVQDRDIIHILELYSKLSENDKDGFPELDRIMGEVIEIFHSELVKNWIEEQSHTLFEHFKGLGLAHS